MSEGFLYFDADDQLVLANSRIDKIYPLVADVFVPGVSYETCMRAGVEKGQWGPTDGQDQEQWIQDRLAYHHDPAGTFDFITSDGRTIRVEEKKTPLGGIVGVRTDISQLKEVERRLRDSDELFRVTVDAMPNALTLKGRNGRYLLVNKTFSSWLNSDPEELVGKTIENLFPENHDDIERLDQEVIKTGEEISCEMPVTYRDGVAREIAFSKSPIRSITGEIFAISTIARDITETKRTEKALKLSEQSLNTLVQSQSDLICRYAPDGVLNFVNTSYAKFVGKDPSDLIGQSIYNDVPKQEIDKLRNYLTHLSKDNPTSIIQNENITENGDTRIFEWINHAHFDASGNVIEIQAVGRDITEVRTAQAEAEAANLAKSSFLATMSHEIRTPLNGVLGLAQLLTDTKLDQDQRKKVDTILSSGQTLLAIINDVLDMSRIEAGGVELEEKVFSLGNLVSMIATPFQNLADEKSLTLSVFNEIDSELFIKGDPVRLRQVLWNLLSNAIKFTEKGKITLTIRSLVDSGNFKVGKNDHLVQFSVEDTGAGIAPARISAIFDAFIQEDNSITRKHGGTGLGLTIVRQLTELMGGGVEVESRLGEGTIFNIQIPFGKATKKETNAFLMHDINDSYGSIEPLNVLIAEDNPVNAEIARAFLEKAGHKVVHVENGKHAVISAKEGWADLILMDIHMPELNGIDATRVIRSSNIGANLPIVGLTAEAFAERHAQFVAAGMDGVFTKPYTEQQLNDTLFKYRGIRSSKKEQPVPEINDVKDRVSDPIVEASDANLPASSTELGPIGDEEKLAEFRQQINAETVTMLLGKAEETLIGRLEELRLGVTKSDSELIRQAAHSVKGACGSMFATRISNLAKIIEEKSKEIDAVGNLMPEFEQTAKETVEWWRNQSV